MIKVTFFLCLFRVLNKKLLLQWLYLSQTKKRKKKAERREKYLEWVFPACPSWKEERSFPDIIVIFPTDQKWKGKKENLFFLFLSLSITRKTADCSHRPASQCTNNSKKEGLFLDIKYRYFSTNIQFLSMIKSSRSNSYPTTMIAFGYFLLTSHYPTNPFKIHLTTFLNYIKLADLLMLRL